MDLLGRARTRAEFERFVAQHADRLLQTGYLITLDLPEAEDLVQECLLRTAKRWPRVRGMAHPGAYARRVLVNLALDGSNRRSRRASELEPVLVGQLGTDSTNGTAALDTRTDLFAVLSTLPPRQRIVLVLRYFEDLSEAQVAQALGCSLGTVKSTTSRGLAQLREVLPEYHHTSQLSSQQTRSSRR
jgi:RNA polymerase sigma-70 factor (sigma-E family)